MRPQSQILQTLRTPEARARLAPNVAQGACQSRAALGRAVCAQFGFVDARGTAQLTGCLKALEVLETEQQIALPAPGTHPQRPSRRCLDAPVPASVEVPDRVRDVEGLRLVVVEDETQRRVWNTFRCFIRAVRTAARSCAAWSTHRAPCAPAAAAARDSSTPGSDTCKLKPHQALAEAA